MSLTGKRAVVTGSTRGIGFAVAKALVCEGAGVMVTSRSEAAIEEAVASLRGLGTGTCAGTSVRRARPGAGPVARRLLCCPARGDRHSGQQRCRCSSPVSMSTR